MLRVRHLLIVFGLIGLMAVPGLVKAVSIDLSCSDSWEGPTERSCGFVSGDRVTVFATAMQGTGTVMAIQMVEGIERTVAECSFAGTEGSKTPSVAASPIKVDSVTVVSPAPTQAPEIHETITPPAITSRTLNGAPGECLAREIATPGVEMACRVRGAGRGIFGCTGLPG